MAEIQPISDPVADAYAAQQAAAQAAATSQFNSGRTNVYDTASERAGNTFRSQRNSILDFLTSAREGQQDIDRGRVKAQLGKDRSSRGIMDMVGRGIRSGGVMLANRNAGDSSATGAIARAYGDLGNRQQAGVNNQFAMENDDFNVAQQRLGTKIESGKRSFEASKADAVDSIVSEARSAFASLNDAAMGAGISERIAIEQEKEAIRQQTLDRLAGLDTELSKVNQVSALDQEGIIGQAGALNRAGQGEGSQYSFTEQAPAQLQGTGAQLGQLPIYSNRRRGV